MVNVILEILLAVDSDLVVIIPQKPHFCSYPCFVVNEYLLVQPHIYHANFSVHLQK